MPIQVKARDVARQFNDRALTTVEKLVAQEIGAVKKTFARVLAEVEKRVDEHFETQQRQGLPPYPDEVEDDYYDDETYYTANIVVPFPNAKDGEVLADEDVADRLVGKITQLLTEHGFECEARLDESSLNLTLSDPKYTPIHEEHLAQSMFEDRLRADE